MGHSDAAHLNCARQLCLRTFPHAELLKKSATVSDEKDPAKRCLHLHRESRNAEFGFQGVRYGIRDSTAFDHTPSRQLERYAQVAREGPVILFAGTIGYTVRDCLDLLADLIATGQVKAELHLCTAMTRTEMQKFGRNCGKIACKGWVSQCELLEALSSADILFLPYSFLESSREAVETAFPSKIADYLAAGKPILVFGPRYSSLVRYASEQGFAEVVDEFSAAALVRGIHEIVFSPLYKEKLAARALEVFSANHDIRCQQQKFYLTLERIVRRSRRGPSG